MSFTVPSQAMLLPAFYFQFGELALLQVDVVSYRACGEALWFPNPQSNVLPGAGDAEAMQGGGCGAHEGRTECTMRTLGVL